jgi:predicted nucleic acid-binding protein
MKPYADTNFLTRCYLLTEEMPAPQSALEKLRAAGGCLPILWLHRLEVPNAFEQHVFAWRTLGQTRVTPEMAAAAHARFEEDGANPASLLRMVVVSLPDLERQFHELSRRHTARHGFRTCDLLHVSSARLLDCDAFWSFDDRANKLAVLEGLKTLAAAARA